MNRIAEAGERDTTVGPPRQVTWLEWAWEQIASVPDAPRRVGAWLEENARLVEYAERIDQLRGFADKAAEQVAMLMAIFVLQTLVLPLLFLWLFWRALIVLIPSALRSQ